MNQHEDVERGRQAAELLAHPLLSEALNAIEAEVVQQWEQCPARDMEGKEALWQLMKTGKKFRGLLNGYIQSGKLAAENIRRMDEHKQGLRGLLQRVRG